MKGFDSALPISVRALTVTAAVSLASTGCLINSGTEKVVEPDAKRMKVEFESEEALMSFQKTVRQRYQAGGGVVSSTGFAIPFVIAAGEKQVLSENAFYNGEVAKADVNDDGVISDVEARAYAE